MRVLITNIILSSRSGTETHSFDLAKMLHLQGDDVCIFTFDASGPLVPMMRKAGVHVVTDLRACPFHPEIIHGHHNLALLAAMEAYPGVPALFVCHDAKAWHDRAPRVPGIALQAAVDELCRVRVAADTGIPLEQIVVIGNAVDLKRFRLRESSAPRPRRALLFSNYASDETFLKTVKEACACLGLELEVAGSAAGKLSHEPETLLPQFDLVFAKARCAMEALCCGCAVVLCGMEGVGPMVTTENFKELRRWNFGRKTLVMPHSVEALVEAVRSYEQKEVEAVARLACEQLNLEDFIRTWREHHAKIVAASAIQAKGQWGGRFKNWLTFGRWNCYAKDHSSVLQSQILTKEEALLLPEETILQLKEGLKYSEKTLLKFQWDLRKQTVKSPLTLRQLVRHPKRFFKELWRRFAPLNNASRLEQDFLKEGRLRERMARK